MRIASALSLSLLLAACATGQTVTGPAAPEGKQAVEASNSLPIADIPIPPGSKLEPDTSLIMGAQDRWLGRLVIRTDTPSTQAYNHFLNGMPAFGWTLVTAVQGRISSLTYLRGERVASLLIEPANLGGVMVSITVSPRQVQPEPAPTPARGSAR
jgi:hypothetical protein